MGGHICVVSKSVTIEKLPKESCSFHHHIGWRELNEYHAEGSLQPVDGVREFAKDSEGREPDYLLEWLVPGRVLRYKRDIALKGMSAKYGPYLAEQLAKGRKWAKVLLQDMQTGRRPKSGNKPSLDDYDRTVA